MGKQIRFGTDGWRAILGHGFTAANVDRVAVGIARGLKPPTVVVGYDARFMSRHFALRVSQILAAEGVDVVMAGWPTPTPAVSLAMVQRRASLGVVLTASHNPALYHGIKLKGPNGATAPTYMTDIVEEALPDAVVFDEGEFQEIERVDLIGPYVKHITGFVDRGIMRDAPEVVLDAIHGVTGEAAEGAMYSDANFLRWDMRPDFGGYLPDPMPLQLGRLEELVKGRSQCAAGFAFDGDGDRVAAVDENGVYVYPHEIMAILFKYLHEEKKQTGRAVTVVNVSSIIGKMAEKYGEEHREVPVGFKHIAPLIEDTEKPALIAGEESGGIWVQGNIPERDGLLAALMVMEAMTVRGCSLGALRDEIMEEFGPHVYRREDVRKDGAAAWVDELDAPNAIGRFGVERVTRTDGLKLWFADGGWLLFRASGTEPVLRIYCEMDSEEKVNEIMAGVQFLVGS